MHVLVVCKRQYTSRDLLDDRYGRLYEIPEGLARLGHLVSGLTVSYRRRPSRCDVSPGGVNWQSVNAVPFGPLCIANAVRQMRRAASPDVVWASSDALQCILGTRIARYLKVPLVLDLYDNYDHFGLSRIPGVTHAFHQACRQASALSVVSETLAAHLRNTLAPGGLVRVIGNGVNMELFHPMDRRECRQRLGLPVDAKLVGCAGAINASRGIDDMFQAFLHLAATIPDLHLVFAGPRDATPERYRHPRIIDMGILPTQQIPMLINSLDASIVCNLDSGFGRYCFPMKLYESMACGVPTVAAAVGDVPMLLPPSDGLAYPPGSPTLLAQALIQYLRAPVRVHSTAVKSWQERSEATQQLLFRLVPNRGAILTTG